MERKVGMDAFMKKFERLSEMAAGRPDPRPLDCGAVMSRIHGLSGLDIATPDDRVLSLPLRFWAGGAAAAAAVALGGATLASTAWMEMASPLTAVDSLFSVLPY